MKVKKFIKKLDNAQKFIFIKNGFFTQEYTKEKFKQLKNNYKNYKIKRIFTYKEAIALTIEEPRKEK